jgi:lysophosphatidylcholine acyltransferase / lyso-PAF acetyltransferase
MAYQKLAEEDNDYPFLAVYPDSTQSNGKYLLPFKKGAFQSLRAVQPIIFEHKPIFSCFVHNQFDCLGFFHGIVLMNAFGAYTSTMKVLPPFLPNDYLFEKHADEGETKALIFAWAVRDAMSKAGNLPKIEADARDKKLYKDFMCGKTDEL